MALGENQFVFFYLVMFSICLTNIYVYIHTFVLVSTLVIKLLILGLLCVKKLITVYNVEKNWLNAQSKQGHLYHPTKHTFPDSTPPWNTTKENKTDVKWSWGMLCNAVLQTWCDFCINDFIAAMAVDTKWSWLKTLAWRGRDF